MNFLIIIFGLIGLLAIAAAETNKVICYYGSWAIYRRGIGKVAIEDIDPSLCTHVVYSFIGLRRDGSVAVLDNWNDISNGGLSRFLNLKKRNPDVKLMIAIGGWNEGSEIYSNVVNSPTLRTRFVNSILTFTLRYKLDGFDIDWEYPGERGGSLTDRSDFIQLLKELRPKFDKYGLILSAAVGASERFHNTAYDVPSLNKYLDFINIMSYDFHGSYDGITGQGAPLYASRGDQDKQLNVHSVIQSWIRAGAEPNKIILGIPLYGRSYSLSDMRSTGVQAISSGAGLPGPYSQEPGMLTYMEICEKQKLGGWTTLWDDEQKTPYTFKGNQWVGYDNPKSIILKAEYAVKHKLAGVMVWSIDQDDVRNVCGNGKYALLKAIGSVIDVGTGLLTTTTEKPIVTTTKPPTTTPSTTTPSTTTPSTTTPSTTTPSTTTPSTTTLSTTTASDGDDVVCENAGYIRDPKNCGVFYKCAKKSDGSFKQVLYYCPTGLNFDLVSSKCLEPLEVNCSND